jgi:hypothetical protein
LAAEQLPADTGEVNAKQVLMENRRLKEENNLLKYKLEVLIDMVSCGDGCLATSSIPSLPPPNFLLPDSPSHTLAVLRVAGRRPRHGRAARAATGSLRTRGAPTTQLPIVVFMFMPGTEMGKKP